MSLRSANPPRKRLLVHLSQAVETLSLRKAPRTHNVPLRGALDGDVKIQCFEVNDREFVHFENISNALIRLDRGIYGRCALCGGRIESEILAETPWINECIGCGGQESQA